ncbi:DoxX family protein [Flaviaesturariibacter terrae]
MYVFFRTLMALGYIAAGINHFWHPAPYVAIMPPWLPAHEALVALSGLAEILLGLGILFRLTRRWSAWGLILLLIAVFPANVQMAINYYHQGHPRLWGALLRLPVQILLIAWAWVYAREQNREV